MSLPDLSYMMTVGRLRYIQAFYECPEYRNPDVLVGDLLPVWRRWGWNLSGALRLASLRAKPFYYYLLARTKYYDEVFVGAMCDGFSHVVNIGAGSDTRAFRFGHLLTQKGMRVLECDQEVAIRAKRERARLRWSIGHVDYLALDLNNERWPHLESWLRAHCERPILVLMEGVSPYVDEESFGRFLELLGETLQHGSRVAYDFKFTGFSESPGPKGRAGRPFRLTECLADVATYHDGFGFRVEHLEKSADLSLRLLPLLSDANVTLFQEDCLVQLSLRA